MFEGVPAEQFHQFIASRTTSLPLPLPLSFPSFHGSSNIPTFDPYSTASQQVPLQPNFLHPILHRGSPTRKNEEKEENFMAAMKMESERERSMPESEDPWSNEEVLSLLRIRSSVENWFSEFTWDHVSRKLAELGFNRSAENCKEKFEEESRYFNNNINYNKNYRVFSELEELCRGDHQNPQDVAAEKNKNLHKSSEKDMIGQTVEEDSRIEQTVRNPTDDNGKEVEKSKSKKRKRQKKFEMFKGFCEDVVNKIMAQQEEMHNKLLEDMVKRDEEKIAREEARKKKEMDRIDKELELRAQEQALTGDRQATLITFLKKFTSSTGSSVEIVGEISAKDLLNKVSKSSNLSPSSPIILSQNPNPSSQTNDQIIPEAPRSSTTTLGHQNSSPFPAKNNPNSLTENQSPQNPSSTRSPNTPKVPTSSSTLELPPQNPNSFNIQNNPSTPTPLSTQKVNTKSTSNDKDDFGRRWPRDEVLALINLRSSLFSSNEDKEGGATKAPLWERISQGMLELGYKRSSKRCKEKWENINKYFRKTKDVNKKRSTDSRTCPYFHQLSTLYNQGKLNAEPSDGPENHPPSPENHPDLLETRLASSQTGPASAFDFEF